VTEDDIPQCACTAHPAGDDRRKYMVAVEEDATKVVWCCRRCTEITHTAVIQVRTLRRGREMAQHRIAEQRRNLDPRLVELLNRRVRGRTRLRPMEGDKKYA
jgi:hypothetical protein